MNREEGKGCGQQLTYIGLWGDEGVKLDYRGSKICRKWLI